MAESTRVDAPDMYVETPDGMGGYVCECGMPTESEPCAEHQPHAFARATGSACPNCLDDRNLFYGRSWCASCGWHEPGSTLHHADFAGDPACRWCNPKPDGIGGDTPT